MKFPPSCRRLLLIAVTLALLPQYGCATRAMKGTPFYTGEWEERDGPVEDRIALWPLLYYRAPALSVLWPFFEKTDDHFAVRPLYSRTGLKEDKPVHNLLWPLGRFDPHRERYRFFPLFWGNDYLTLFPFFWHDRDPFGEKGGLSALWPLWIYTAGDHGRDLRLLWPFFRFRNETGIRQTSFWPLYGAKTVDENREVFWLWPLGQHTRRGESVHTRWFPFYAAGREPDGFRYVYSPLYFRGDDAKRGDHWHAVVPLYFKRVSKTARLFATLLGGVYRRNDGTRGTVTPLYCRWEDGPDRRTTVVPPLLSWLSVSPSRSDLSLLGALGRFSWGTAPGASWLFPLFDIRKDHYFHTLLYGRDHKTDGVYTYWLTPLIGTYRNTLSGGWFWPVYTHRKNPAEQTEYTRVLWGSRTVSPNERHIQAFPFFSRHHEQWTPGEPPSSFSRPRYLQRDRTSVLLLYRNETIRWPEPTQAPPHIKARHRLLSSEHAHRLFPLWSWRQKNYRDGKGVETSGSVLWPLYDFRREEGNPEEPHDYVRRRLLWRLWHYEKLNGDVSADAFPFITYDRKKDGFKKISFLWRVFRYESRPGEASKLDLLFIPLKR